MNSILQLKSIGGGYFTSANVQQSKDNYILDQLQFLKSSTRNDLKNNQIRTVYNNFSFSLIRTTSSTLKPMAIHDIYR